MSIVGDILSVTKELEGRAKDRRDIDELRQIQSLALTLQSSNTEIVERDLRVMQEIVNVKAENAKLKEELSQANAEEVRIAGGIEARFSYLFPVSFTESAPVKAVKGLSKSELLQSFSDDLAPRE